MSCAAEEPPQIRDQIAARSQPALPTEPAPRLALPARVALVRVIDGRVSFVPSEEAVLWRASEQRVNRFLSGTLRLFPLADPTALNQSAPAPGQAQQGNDLDAALDAMIAQAAGQGFDAVLIYQLAVDVADNRTRAALSKVPLFGGIVPRTVATEGRGVGSATLVDLRTQRILTQASTKMGDSYVAPFSVSGGDGDAVRDRAKFAVLNVLLPRVEDAFMVLLSAPSRG